jgi:glutamate/aspartate transport system substrate-binding protein
MRTPRARRAGGRGARMAVGVAVALTTASMLAICPPAAAQEASDVGALSGTLKRVKQTGAITLGYRESSLPFSYLNRLWQPIGYSIDLCREIVDDVSTELDGMDIRIGFAPVTPANRLQRVAAGEVDIECGSTTANAQRREQVAFSPIFFIAGTKLMVPKDSPVRSYRDLAGKTAVVTAGTTNEAALRALSDKQKLGISIISAPDHTQSLQTLISGKADAFATDDVLLYGFIATDPNARDMKVVGEYLSYDPYGLAYRRDDRPFAGVVERTFVRIAGERRLAELYNKWFLRRLPTGETLNLPMSPELSEIFRMMGQPE